MKPTKFECVVVCVNYADFLAHTLPTNKSHFDRMVVVTTPEDKRTQKLCEYWHVQTVVSEVCYEDGASFNKGKMINEGLKALSGEGWVVHMDADIFLPPLFRDLVQSLELDPEDLYHIDRMMCDNFADWCKFWAAPALQHEANIYVHPRPFPLGVRLAKKEYGGWIPLGFFQMWHQGSKKLSYPDKHTDAGRSDLLFSQLFGRKNRSMLPEIIAIHLETKLEDGEMGSNWNGRKTPAFGPIPVAPASSPEANNQVYCV